MDLAHARALAEEYAAQYNPKSIAPFPYENVLKDKNDLEIFFTDLEDDDTSGVTIYKDGTFSILINSAKPETRQHFTLGHELGHYFLHQDFLKSETGIVDSDDMVENVTTSRLDAVIRARIEDEANIFAASLLMPADLVRRGWQATHSIEESADVFKVSVVAMSIRMTQLGLVGE